MKKNDDFATQITKKLDRLAQNHEHTSDVMHNVLAQVEKQRQRRQNIWKMTSFALAATVAGFLILPSAFDLHHQSSPEQVVININSNKLSPQMMEDLEMVMVFGEDKNTHGS
ncbi:hypothetical protein [Acinetobacter sp. MD2]|uniref:hypothetical protein n=1 Tax=Acinetobacter sp. MD2 TaxID=2600066 RepID=UPI002D1E9F67|nr:hypothetical protein [Acinetobacter sp. MD2]MEB3766259.1 hypothetical protein [Acinetobacter sp. MD2]